MQEQMRQNVHSKEKLGKSSRRENLPPRDTLGELLTATRKDRYRILQ